MIRTFDSPQLKSCCRCGSEFRTKSQERVCFSCRKPKPVAGAEKKELTFREKQIVGLIAQGKANKEIAYRLFLSEGTVKEYLVRIFRKLEVANRTELAVWAFSQSAATQDV